MARRGSLENAIKRRCAVAHGGLRRMTCARRAGKATARICAAAAAASESPAIYHSEIALTGKAWSAPLYERESNMLVTERFIEDCPAALISHRAFWCPVRSIFAASTIAFIFP